MVGIFITQRFRKIRTGILNKLIFASLESAYPSIHHSSFTKNFARTGKRFTKSAEKDNETEILISLDRLLTREDKTRQCFIWSLIQSYVYRLYPNNLKL